MSVVHRVSPSTLRRWTSPSPLLDAVVVTALLTADVIAQSIATAGVDVPSATLGVGPVAIAAVNAGVLYWRRARPLVVLGAVVAIHAIAAATIEPGLFTQSSGAAAFLTLFAVASWCERRRWAVAIPVLLLVLIVLGSLDDGSGIAESLTVALAIVALPWVLGLASRTRRLYLLEVEHRLADAERERDTRARQAVLDERAHIARELHDVVAHHVSLIGVQAGAARTALDRSPSATRAALEAIEDSSRQTIGEMRHVLDALRDADRGTPLAPQPRLADVDRLVSGFASAGVRASVRRTGTKTSLPPLLELCCYRIVEEALTNVSRHSASAVAIVEIDQCRDRVRIVVTDPGPARHPLGRGGRGLIGMHERVALFQGSLAVGPAPDGGFIVAAELPALSGAVDGARRVGA
jgi:signal transduction histidine kinase